MYDRSWRIYSKNPIAPPQVITENAQVSNSMVVDGCYVDGIIEHSILSTNVDVQVKRMHAYKRQTLKLLHILKLYQDLKAGIDHSKRVVIFSAKAAPSYVFAKQIIKVINEAANMINNDPDIHGKLKVVFLENYDVSLAEKIIPAADINEQISTTTKEASGTSNMKLMASGALTVATMDGANIEIKDAVGAENIFTFGLNKDQVYKYYAEKSYHPRQMYEEDPVMKKAVDALIDGTVPNCSSEG